MLSGPHTRALSLIFAPQQASESAGSCAAARGEVEGDSRRGEIRTAVAVVGSLNPPPAEKNQRSRSLGLSRRSSAVRAGELDVGTTNAAQ
jgi:hypothetical protein